MKTETIDNIVPKLYSRSITNQTRSGMHQCLLLAMTIMLSGCLTTTGREFSTDLFEQFEVVIGNAKRETILSGFFLDRESAEVAVLHIGQNNHRYLRMFGLDRGILRLMREVELASSVQFVDVANIGGRDRLLAYESGKISWFDPDLGELRLLLAVTTNYEATSDDYLPQIDITRDINLDGLDDIILADLDGFWTSIQLKDGSFSTALKLGPIEPFLEQRAFGEKRIYKDVGINEMNHPWYLSRVHLMDYNHDGRSDLVFWDLDHFEINYQNELGLFESAVERFIVGVPFDSDGIYSLIFGFDEQSTLSIIFGYGEFSKQKILHSFRDVNGDQIADLVFLSMQGPGIMKQRSELQIHFGSAGDENIIFAKEPSTRIIPSGTAGGMLVWGYSSQTLLDVDGDQQLEIVFDRVRMGIGGMLRALVGQSISMDLEAYQMEGGVFPDQPNYSRKIRPEIESFSRRGPFFPLVLVGDINGDGHSDLLVGKSWYSLDVFVGVAGPALFATQSQSIAVQMPVDERNSWLLDWNKDDKKDLLIHQTSNDEPHRLTLLVAQ
jgi:hypothetical protein